MKRIFHHVFVKGFFCVNGPEDQLPECLFRTDRKEQFIFSGTVSLPAGICQKGGENPLSAVSRVNEGNPFPGMKICPKQEQAAGQLILILCCQPEAVCICGQRTGKAGCRKAEIKKSGKL